jgi:hypothetical protein
MKEQFVPYELALKLKELGFDEEGFGMYNENGEVLPFKPYTSESKAILFQQAFRWFREKYGLFPHIFSNEIGTFVWCIRWYVDNEQKDTPYFSSITYEEAELACLDKLIEIVETKQQDNENSSRIFS